MSWQPNHEHIHRLTDENPDRHVEYDLISNRKQCQGSLGPSILQRTYQWLFASYEHQQRADAEQTP